MALQESFELRDLCLRFYQAMEAGNASQALGLVSREQGGLSIGTDPAEWWSDYASVERVYDAQLPEMRDASVRFQPGEVQCYHEGTVGWCADRPRIILPDGTEQSMNLTAVFHKEGDTWKVVQSHACFGVPNADAIGTDLTI